MANFAFDVQWPKPFLIQSSSGCDKTGALAWDEFNSRVLLQNTHRPTAYWLRCGLKIVVVRSAKETAFSDSVRHYWNVLFAERKATQKATQNHSLHYRRGGVE